MNRIYFIPFLFVLLIIYLSLNPDVLIQDEKPEQNQLESRILELKLEQIRLIEEQLNKKQEPVDCVGEWKDIGICKIDRCDPDNNQKGLGKKKQEFVIKDYPKNGGRPCEGPTRDIDCIEDNYIDCLLCGGKEGEYAIGTNCTNINSCDPLDNTTGIGERIDIWTFFEKDRLKNCLVPPNRKMSCYKENHDKCTCKFIPDNTTCNSKNTYCIKGDAICNPDYTFSSNLPGGKCDTSSMQEPTFQVPTLNNLCDCTVIRSIPDEWQIINESCSGKTYNATRSRKIKITKTGGLRGCTFPKLQDEDSEDIFKNPHGNFQFSSDNDELGATFDIIEKQNISLTDNDKCICEGPRWKDITSCPSRTDYTLSSNDFYKEQIKETTKQISGITCEKRTIACSRDCRATPNEWTPCNNEGIQIRTFTETHSKLVDGNTCPTTETINCSFNCVGTFDEEWSPCIIEKNEKGEWLGQCDPANPMDAIGGKRTKRYKPKFPAVNGGAPCPSDQKQSCKIIKHPPCIQCPGQWGGWSSCQNITECGRYNGTVRVGPGTTGKGIESRFYKSSTAEQPLQNCIMPKAEELPCAILNYSECTCKYTPDNICNYINTYCVNDVPICEPNYSIEENLNGGITCANLPQPKISNPTFNDPSLNCSCAVKIIDDNVWEYINPICDKTGRLKAASRSKKRTIQKINGLRGCTFPKRQNESIIDNTKGIFLDDKFQFSSNNDNINATFDVKITETNIDLPNNELCTCVGGDVKEDSSFSIWTDWKNVNGSSCPDPNSNIPDTNFYIQQSRTRTYRTTRDISESICPGKNEQYTKEVRTIKCAKNCLGDWDEKTECSAACPGNANHDNGGKSSGIIEKIFRIRRHKNDIGASCPYTDGTIQKDSDCTRGCALNCIGGYSGYDCVNCCPSIYGKKIGQECNQYRDFNQNVKGPFHGGAGCPGTETTTCTIDCLGASKSDFTMHPVGDSRLCLNADGGRNANRKVHLYPGNCIPFTIDSSGVLRDNFNTSYYLAYNSSKGQVEYTHSDNAKKNGYKTLFCNMPTSGQGEIYCQTEDKTVGGWFSVDNIAKYDTLRIKSNRSVFFYY